MKKVLGKCITTTTLPEQTSPSMATLLPDTSTNNNDSDYTSGETTELTTNETIDLTTNGITIDNIMSTSTGNLTEANKSSPYLIYLCVVIVIIIVLSIGIIVLYVYRKVCCLRNHKINILKYF